MAKAITSKRRAQAISSALFLLGMAVLFIMDSWWPWIFLVLGITLALRQYLLGRMYDMCISLLIFIGGFITLQYDIPWQILFPALFAIAGVYILIREFTTIESEAEREEDLNHELEEKKKGK